VSTPAPRSDGWLDRPQQRPLRKLLFQVHLWLGIATGLYIVLISVSGSAVVFRRELNLWLVPHRIAVVDGARLSKTELSAAALAIYPGYRVARVGEPPRQDRPVSIELERGGESKERLFDPYTGRDLGDSFPPVLRAVEWLVSLHDDLLGGTAGRRVNGIGAAIVIGLVATGAVIWWPGRRRWLTSVVPKRGRNAPRLMWQLHSVLGFWSFALLAIWALTGVYFAFPEPFERLIDAFDNDPNDFYRPGEAVLLGMIKLHFGRFGGLTIRVLWTLLGLLPALLFITGFTLWWRRVVRRKPGTLKRASGAVELKDDRRSRRDSSAAPAPATPSSPRAS
jgi:uncharacterized iron-regulated membrane protein